MGGLLGAVRPGAWEFPLFLHVLGAMLLVGALVTVLSALVLSWRREGADAALLTRFAFRSLLLAVLPSFVLMRVAAQWTFSREFGEAANPDWVDIGYLTADLGVPVLVLAAILAGLAMRGTRRGDTLGLTGRVATVIVALLVAAYLVAMWAMTTKPGA